jgi:hypothetical protein
MTDVPWVSGWIAWGCRETATALRAVAEDLDRLAIGLENGTTSAIAGAPVEAPDLEATRPLGGTRERMTAALARARGQYDTATAPVRGTGGQRSPGGAG